jgi:hypothetical protein
LSSEETRAIKKSLAAVKEMRGNTNSNDPFWIKLGVSCDF